MVYNINNHNIKAGDPVMGSNSSFTKYILLILVVVAALLVFRNTGGDSNNSVSGTADPVQTSATGGTQFEAAGYSVDISYNYSYEIDALVVHTKDYFGSSLSDTIAPVDVALAWGKVAEYNDRIDFNWSQSGRWYYWRTDSYEEIAVVGGEGGVNTHSSNNHLIPADDNIKKLVKSIKTGDHIKITGYLVNVFARKPDGTTFSWNSSSSRNDTGDGACEVIYVTKVEFLN